MSTNYSNYNYSQYSSQFTVVYRFPDIIVYTMRSIGTLTSIINIAVLAHPLIQKSSDTFKYLLNISIFELLYLAPLLATNLINKACAASSTLCSPGAQYTALFMAISIQNYLSASIAIYNINMEIFLTVQRVFSFENKKFPSKLTVRQVIMINLVISLVFYTPLLFFTIIEGQTIQLIDANVTEFVLVSTNTVADKITPVSLSAVRLFMCGPVLFTVSIINIIFFRRYLKKKNSVVTSRASSSNRMSMLILITAINTFIGNLPYMIFYSASQIIVDTSGSEFMNFMDWFSRVCLCSLIILKLPLYIVFNRLYRRQLLRLMFIGNSDQELDSWHTSVRRYRTISNRSTFRRANTIHNRY